MNTWRRSGLGRGSRAEPGGERRVMISRTKEADLRERERERAGSRGSQRVLHYPPKQPHPPTPCNTTGTTLENFLKHFFFLLLFPATLVWLSCAKVCMLASASPPKCAVCVCKLGCVRACRVQRQTCPRGRKILKIGYCIAEAIYLFWGLTYLIPRLNPVEVNALAFPII